NLSNRQIQHIEDRLNHRPRKTLGYKTPHEVLFNLQPNSVAIRT
ncbi:MAG: IS30 family transposase, partial [Undibacterium sp.]|nr:IS30 family transposase [Undibacterium sp.]MDO8703109.1 IS30 family transposase [Undibacterium sp.]